MTDAELKKAVDAIAKRYSDLNIRYIRQIAEQIKAIGELNPKSLNQIAEMLRMNANLSEIVMELQRLTELTKQDVRTIMQRITEDEVMDARYLPYYAEQSGLPESEITPALAKQYAGAEAQERLRRMTLAMAAQTDDRLDNLSNTTALAEPYRQAVDRAVLAVSENVTSYTEAMRDTVRELGHAGMQVQYESGYHRRLDTAVRQNILDAAGQLAQTAAITVGEALNYNAFEISAHAMSAPDHEPVQGHVFLTDEFYKLQQNQPSQDADGQQFDAIRRPIKEWNCGHFAFPFDTRFSKRKYTPEQLQKFIDDNKAGCVIGQKRYTLYEASQIMRRIECEIRREKDTAVAAQAAGDDQLRVDCQLRINHLSGLYKQVTDASGLTPRRERMTVEGFRRAKVPEDSEKVLTSSGGSGIIKSGSEGMFRKSRDDKIEPMPKKQFQRIAKNFKRQGGIMQTNEETDRYLESKHAEAITYDAKTILIHSNPSRASVFEELIHSAQYRLGQNNGSYVSRLECEISAQQKLIRNSKAYKLTVPEIEQTKKALEAYQKELDTYLKNGGV